MDHFQCSFFSICSTCSKNSLRSIRSIHSILVHRLFRSFSRPTHKKSLDLRTPATLPIPPASSSTPPCFDPLSPSRTHRAASHTPTQCSTAGFPAPVSTETPIREANPASSASNARRAAASRATRRTETATAGRRTVRASRSDRIAELSVP